MGGLLQLAFSFLSPVVYIQHEVNFALVSMPFVE